MEKNIKSIGQQDSPQRPSSKGGAKKQKVKRPKSAPGPGGSQENERTEYHEETSRKAVGTSYDFQPEKNLDD